MGSEFTPPRPSQAHTEPLRGPMPPPPPGTAPETSERNGWISAATVLALALVLGIAVGVGLIVVGAEDEPSTTITETTRGSLARGEPAIGGEGAGSAAVDAGGVASAPAAGSAVTASFRTYVPDDPDYYYLAEIPSGAAWGEPVESYPTGGALLRTTVRGPDGAVLIIDRTPGEVPQLGGGYDSEKVVPQPRFGIATQYMFSSSESIPECNGAPCVDYLIDDETGGGWGVLAGGTDIDAATGIAARVARSITDADL